MDDVPPLTRAGAAVLDAASTLFYRQGIHAVGVALVAETAGVTKKTLYDCFGSKDALVVHYLRRRHHRWWAHLESVLEAAEHPRSLALFDAYLSHPGLEVDRGCCYLNAAAELDADHPGMAVIREHKRLVRARLEEVVGQDRPQAGAAEVGELAETLFLLLEGATAQLGLGDPDRVAGARLLARRHLDRVAGTDAA